MNNPYKVLGVNENATQEEIRAAYLQLVKKYHPDRYTDPDLKAVANEKLVEINEAYEFLTKKSSGSANRGPGSGQGYGGGYSGAGSAYAGPNATEFARARAFWARITFRLPRRCWTAFPSAMQNGIICMGSFICARAGSIRRGNT